MISRKEYLERPFVMASLREQKKKTRLHRKCIHEIFSETNRAKLKLNAKQFIFFPRVEGAYAIKNVGELSRIIRVF